MSIDQLIDPLKIEVEQRAVYGACNFYPVNGLAQAMAAVAKTKTLTADTLFILKKAGFEIVVVPSETAKF